MSFRDFILKQVNEDSQIGDLARDVKKDVDLGNWNGQRLTPNTLRNRLDENQANQGAYDALARATERFNRESKPTPTPTLLKDHESTQPRSTRVDKVIQAGRIRTFFQRLFRKTKRQQTNAD